MDGQLTIDDVMPRPVVRQPLSLSERFAIWHAQNPHVYDLFKRFALQVFQTGRQRYSADAILHRIRWHLDIDTVSDDGFKINNNHAAEYARMLMAEEPLFVGFFETRVRKSQSGAA